MNRILGEFARGVPTAVVQPVFAAVLGPHFDGAGIDV